MPIRVLVADDDAGARATLAGWLSYQDGIEVVGEASGGAEVLEMLPSIRADVVLMDVRMPGLSGLDAVDRLREAGDRTPVVLVSADESASEEASRRDGVCFLWKGGTGPAQTADAVRGAAGRP